MRYTRKINILLLSENTETGKFLDQTLSTRDISHSVLVFKSLENLMAYLCIAPISIPQLLFIDVNDGSSNYIKSIKLIRSNTEYKEISMVIYDPLMAVPDIEEAFAAGVNIYIHRQDSFRQLKKNMETVVNLGWQFYMGNFNRETCFISI